MKYGLFFFLSLCVLQTFSQQKADSTEQIFIAALNKAKASDKLLYVFIYDLKCEHCIKMKNGVLADSTVINFINQNYISVALESSLKFTSNFIIKYQINGFPTFLFLNNNEEDVYNFSGVFTLKEFLLGLKTPLNPKQQLPYLQKEFEADTANAQKCYNYLKALRPGIFKYKMDGITRKYLSTQSAEKLISPINWQVISFGMNDIQSKEFQFIIDHQSDYEKIIPIKKIEEVLIPKFKKTLADDLEKRDTASFLKDWASMKKINSPSSDSFSFKQDLKAFELQKKWPSFIDRAKKGIKKYAWTDDKTLTEIGIVYLKFVTEKNNLTDAVNWINHSIELNDSYLNNFLITKLFLKLSDKQNAIFYARKVRQMAVQKNIKTTEIDEILKSLDKKL